MLPFCVPHPWARPGEWQTLLPACPPPCRLSAAGWLACVVLRGRRVCGVQAPCTVWHLSRGHRARRLGAPGASGWSEGVQLAARGRKAQARRRLGLPAWRPRIAVLEPAVAGLTAAPSCVPLPAPPAAGLDAHPDRSAQQHRCGSGPHASSRARHALVRPQWRHIHVSGRAKQLLCLRLRCAPSTALRCGAGSPARCGPMHQLLPPHWHSAAPTAVPLPSALNRMAYALNARLTAVCNCIWLLLVAAYPVWHSEAVCRSSMLLLPGITAPLARLYKLLTWMQ